MNWLIGLSLLFGISIGFSYLLGFSIDTLLPSIFITSLFTSWSELLPSEITFVLLIFNVIYMLYINKVGKYFPVIVVVILGIINLFLGHTIETITFNRIETTHVFSLDLQTISVSILTGSLLIIALLGFQILGSGFSDESLHLLSLILFYAGLWLLLTPLAWNLIMNYKVIGLLVYFSMLVSYIFVVIRNIGSGA